MMKKGRHEKPRQSFWGRISGYFKSGRFKSNHPNANNYLKKQAVAMLIGVPVAVALSFLLNSFTMRQPLQVQLDPAQTNPTRNYVAELSAAVHVKDARKYTAKVTIPSEDLDNLIVSDSRDATAGDPYSTSGTAGTYDTSGTVTNSTLALDPPGPVAVEAEQPSVETEAEAEAEVNAEPSADAEPSVESEVEPTIESTAEPIVEPTPVEVNVYDFFTEEEVIMLAKLIYGEARGVYSVTEQAGIVWTVLNRIDSPSHGSTISSVVLAPNQFYYVASSPTVDDYGRDLKWLTEDVLTRYLREKNGETDVGRVLPVEYRFYSSKGDGHNGFAVSYGSYYSYISSFGLASPYET